MESGPEGGPENRPENRPEGGSGEGSEVVRCARHPDRPAGVRCTRCGRPICPECMISASVGFQCPDCVRGAGRAARGGVLGSGATDGGRAVGVGALGDSPVTTALIGVCVLVWLLELALGSGFVDRFTMLGGAYVPGMGVQGVATSPWQSYRLLTAVFLHEVSSPPIPWHLGTNMLLLWWIGAPLEGMLGRARYLAVFLVSGLAGSALSLLLAAPNQPSLGASGAIFGLIGASVVLYRRRGYALGPLVALIVFNLVVTFSIPDVAWQAHVGGLVAGGVVAAAMAYAPRAKRRRMETLAVAGVLVLVALVSWWGTVRITG
ncbi:rhomboid family intramembrane serine protease [Phaeacidiphilus oryzae]|uniref:rhomboid family intramembrane serine protease n=1 Tax=Phaeacidiphilus oryzae TaxID=348818 RepID=UPI0009FC5898